MGSVEMTLLMRRTSKRSIVADRAAYVDMTSVESNMIETVGDPEVQSVGSDALEGYDMIEAVVAVVVEEHALEGGVVQLEPMSAPPVHLTGSTTFYSSEERGYWR